MSPFQSWCDILSLAMLTLWDSWPGVCRATLHWGVLLGQGDGVGGSPQKQVSAAVTTKLIRFGNRQETHSLVYTQVAFQRGLCEEKKKYPFWVWSASFHALCL